MRLLASIWAFSFSLVGSRVFAAEIGPEGGLLSVDVHGFASQGFIFTSRNTTT
jgi:hypothetical protein